MQRLPSLLCAALLCLGSFHALTASAQTAASQQKPNIIIILSDDMGFSDIGCFGSEISTPNLDQLAGKGLRFNQFYNNARCCPTRASLLTGLYPHQAGIGHMTDDRQLEGYRGDLNRNCVTIAEALKPAGYSTYAVGKWHVTKFMNARNESEKFNWPLQRGFDRYYGTIHGAGSYFDPGALVRNNTQISPFADPEYKTPEFYYTDAISDHAARFVREHAKPKPFFMYVAYTAAHWPMQAKETDIAKYKGRYSAGYEAIRKARYEKELKLGVIRADNTTLFPIEKEAMETGEFWDWDQRNMEVYAAMIDCMDQGIGRIVAALKESGQYDNTLIFFLQDNGGCAESQGRSGIGKQRAEAPSLPPIPNGFLQGAMLPKQTRDGYPMRQGKGVMAGGADTYIGYGQAWATVSDTPFRKYKHYVYEGGISTPLIVHWPKGIKSPGRLEQTPAHLIDLMATAVDLSNAKYPANVHPMEGVSLAPLFKDGSIQREAIYWEHEGNRAVRVGDWKLVADHNKRWELYNLATDRSEQNDLSQKEPERVQKMAALWGAYAKRTLVEPVENLRNAKPDKKPAKPGKAKAGNREAE